MPVRKIALCKLNNSGLDGIKRTVPLCRKTYNHQQSINYYQPQSIVLVKVF